MDKLIIGDTELSVIDHGGQPCLTLAEVATALYGKGVTEMRPPLKHACVTSTGAMRTSSRRQ
ncbi:hypothetical protein QFA96_23030 [Pseudomonas sp. Ap32]|nr:hypothetical protein QFA96_23030 [Pseudomonas sp. Ap32]